MTKSLHLTGNKYNIAVMVFTIAYVVCGVPANIVFKKTGPRSLSVMMFVWGLFALGQGFSKTWGSEYTLTWRSRTFAELQSLGLVACRFMMGIFEAGFVCVY